VPRARLNTPDGTTTEWKSRTLRRKAGRSFVLIAEHFIR
jgi:hypothetical protein